MRQMRVQTKVQQNKVLFFPIISRVHAVTMMMLFNTYTHTHTHK